MCATKDVSDLRIFSALMSSQPPPKPPVFRKKKSTEENAFVTTPVDFGRFIWTRFQTIVAVSKGGLCVPTRTLCQVMWTSVLVRSCWHPVSSTSQTIRTALADLGINQIICDAPSWIYHWVIQIYHGTSQIFGGIGVVSVKRETGLADLKARLPRSRLFKVGATTTTRIGFHEGSERRSRRPLALSKCQDGAIFLFHQVHSLTRIYHVGFSK